jgi:ribosome-associated protein
MLTVTNRINIPLSEFAFTFARSGGPGGQNVNKVNSKAILRWSVTTSPSLPEDVRSRFETKFTNRLTTEGDLVLSSQKYRDQIGNSQDCLNKLKEMLMEVAERPVMRRETRPTLGSKVRRVETKRVNAVKKQGRRQPAGDY